MGKATMTTNLGVTLKEHCYAMEERAAITQETMRGLNDTSTNTGEATGGLGEVVQEDLTINWMC